MLRLHNDDELTGEDFPLAGTALPDLWIWKIINLNVQNAERVGNSDLSERGVKAGREGMGRSALALIKMDEGNEYRYLVVYDNYELHRRWDQTGLVKHTTRPQKTSNSLLHTRPAPGAVR